MVGMEKHTCQYQGAIWSSAIPGETERRLSEHPLKDTHARMRSRASTAQVSRRFRDRRMWMYFAEQVDW